MAVFISNAITDRGRILLGEAQVGATLEATRIVMGSGYIPSGSTAATMTAVVAPVIELAINKKKRAGDGTVTFGGAFSNETITEAFYFREFALFARVQYADGTYSDEALYSYGNAGGNADLIPAYSTSTVVEKQMDLVVWVGNETQVNLTVASGLYNAHAEKHAADGEDPITPEMIGALASGIVTNIDSISGEGVFNVMGFATGTFPPELNELTTDTRYVGVIIHKVWDGNYAEQIFFSYATLKAYHRALRENIWTQWDNFLSFRGDTAIEGMLHVNNGSGRVFSWADADYFGVAIDSVRNETVGRLEVLTREDKAQGYVSFFDGSAWHSLEIYHTGNAPAAIATAELV